MQKFKESFRANTPVEIGQLQSASRSASTGKRKRRNKSRGGLSFGRNKGTSGSEADDETQLTFYTEQYRSRRRSKGLLKSPVNKTALTLIAVSSCILAMVCGNQMSCPLTVKVTLHVPEHFIADGKSPTLKMTYNFLSPYIPVVNITIHGTTPEFFNLQHRN
ncbi:Astrotactin-2 [Microtus ochrogaster]|uniref:Astrotactin-2 n=1 Tax=Microtus ochrogaster TaxID=79684 RepID=A0A8J6GSH4_MICOH|nr:Astrotactin-2 [Microtus ochrogaster]